MNHTRTLVEVSGREIKGGGHHLFEVWQGLAGISNNQAIANAERLKLCWNACEKAALTNEQLKRGFSIGLL